MPTFPTLTTLNANEARLDANPAVTRWSTLLIDARGAFHCTLECSGSLRLLANSQAPVTISAIELWGWVTTVWLKKVGIKLMQIYPGSPWENGYNERFNGTLRREVLNAEWFHTTRQAQVAINVWLRQYNRIRPHHALNMRPPVPETLLEKPKINGRI